MVDLNDVDAEKLRALEQELSLSLVPVRSLATLSDSVLTKVKAAEKDLKVVLLAFE